LYDSDRAREILADVKVGPTLKAYVKSWLKKHGSQKSLKTNLDVGNNKRYGGDEEIEGDEDNDDSSSKKRRRGWASYMRM